MFFLLKYDKMQFDMADKSKILPKSISEALKSLMFRMIGVIVLCLGIWATFALLFYNPYLNGFGVASSFGTHSLMGWVVGMVRYAIGVVPGLFVFLSVARWGAVRTVGLDTDGAPEYNFLRGFITVCVGAVGFGALMPSSTFGGMFGAIAAADLVSLIGGWTVVVGIVCMAAFLVLGGSLLHIKWSHVRGALRMFVKWLRAIATAFHLMQPVVASDEGEVEEDDAAQEEEQEEEQSKPEPKIKLLRKKLQKKTAVAKTTAAAVAVAPKRAVASSEFQLPSPRLLEASAFTKYSVTPELKQEARAIEKHFSEYGVFGKVVGIKPGPVVTLYEFEPEPGQRIADISKTAKDMTRAMAVENFRISMMAKSNFLGVEVANIQRQMVRYRGMMEDDVFVNSKYKLPLGLGVDIGGHPVYFDLAKMPHMMIAGRTGSGKSVFVQSIITSLVYRNTPDKCKIMIIDPKGVDFGFWNNIPHLITPIVKQDATGAINALKWAVREMEARFQQLGKLNARNIESYNDIMAEKRRNGEKMTRQVVVGTDPETGEYLYETQEESMADMPYLVIFIDEVADLMAVARKEVELCVQRIAQKARAAGIHLIMATQRPDATIITGVIKANFPTRVSFQAASRIDSMTSLGQGGAEQLLSMGDMLFSEGGHPAVRIHGAYISDDELTKIGDFLRSQGEPVFAEGVTVGEDDAGDSVPGMPGAIPGAGGASGGKDGDLYERAKEFVIRDKKPTISYIQRRLGIGYNKAASLIERMETDGILSAPDAKNKRQILV